MNPGNTVVFMCVGMAGSCIHQNPHDLDLRQDVSVVQRQQEGFADGQGRHSGDVWVEKRFCHFEDFLAASGHVSSKAGPSRRAMDLDFDSLTHDIQDKLI